MSAGSALLAVALIIASALAFVLARRDRLPACTAEQRIEVRAMTRECLTHTGDDWCSNKVARFVGCEP